MDNNGTKNFFNNDLKRLGDELDPKIYPELIDSFKVSLNQLLKEEKFDIVVTHKGKGTNFYNFLKDEDINIPSKGDLFIQESDIKNKNVLWFDDAIRTGNTADTEIKSIISKKPCEITIATLLITNTILEKIREKYDYRPLGIVVPCEYYNPIYQRIFFPLIGMMDYYLEEYPLFILDIKPTNNLDFNELKRIISKSFSSDNDEFEVPFLFAHSNIYKYSIHFDNFPLKLDSPIKCKTILSKIRIWMYFNDIDKIRLNIKPIYHPFFEESDEKCSEDYDFCFKKNNIKTNYICKSCITYLHCRELGNYFYKKLGEELDVLNIKWEINIKLPYN